MVDEWSNKHTDKEIMQFINQCMSNIDFVEGVDYGSFLRAKNKAKPKSGKSNMGGTWFGIGQEFSSIVTERPEFCNFSFIVEMVS